MELLPILLPLVSLCRKEYFLDKYYASSPTKRERKIIIKRENSNKQIFHLSLIKEKESHGQKLRFIPHQKERKKIIKRENSTKQILQNRQRTKKHGLLRQTTVLGTMLYKEK